MATTSYNAYPTSDMARRLRLLAAHTKLGEL